MCQRTEEGVDWEATAKRDDPGKGAVGADTARRGEDEEQKNGKERRQGKGFGRCSRRGKGEHGTESTDRSFVRGVPPFCLLKFHYKLGL